MFVILTRGEAMGDVVSKQDLIGNRVIVIAGSDLSTVWLVGYGTYVGDDVPPFYVDEKKHIKKVKTSKIELDSGQLVWGCECWWKLEQMSDRIIKKKKIVHVSVEQLRRYKKRYV